MSQPQVKNNTALTYEILFASDEDMKPLVCPIIKATYNISPNGELVFSEKQIPVNLAGEHYGDPESSSYLYEPECAFIKPATDIVILGDAVSNKGPVKYLSVDVNVGQYSNRLLVFGDRQWEKKGAQYHITEPMVFENMPMMYENSFGGWDKRHDDCSKHGFEARNTVGKGFYLTDVEPVGVMPLPNIENPNQLIQDINDRPNPVGLGFTLPHWQPRTGLAGTYDQQWQEKRFPLLAEDFDRRFFNAASSGFVSSGYMSGNEPVSITNMTPDGQLAFNLPGINNPRCHISTSEGNNDIETNLDTIIIDTRNMQLQIIWRNYLLLNKSAHEVSLINIAYG